MNAIVSTKSFRNATFTHMSIDEFQDELAATNSFNSANNSKDSTGEAQDALEEVKTADSHRKLFVCWG
jgi:hypothetical protein